MDLGITIIGLITCIGLAALGYYKHFQKRDDRLVAPLLPWDLIALAALATGFMLLVHLVNLGGIETGR